VGYHVYKPCSSHATLNYRLLMSVIADLRRHRLVLTPEGRKAMCRGLALLSDAFGARLGRLSAPEQASLRTLPQKLN
jgi:hypothetical protein